jgi:O-antigen/teichoic acid export membrane protein
VSFALNMGLNLWLIPRYGILASAALSVLGELVNLAVVWLWCRRRGLQPSLRALLWPALPAALGMGLLLALLGPAAVAGMGPLLAALTLVLSGAALYAGLLAVLGFIGDDERALLARLLGRPA